MERSILLLALLASCEVLVNAACQWEFRYRVRWTAMISSVDNFAAPLEDVSLVKALRRAPVENVSTILVPIVEGFSINGRRAFLKIASGLVDVRKRGNGSTTVKRYSTP